MKLQLELKVQFLTKTSPVHYLKRTLTWTSRGVTWAANATHIDKLREAMQLPDVVNGVLTPMAKEAYREDGNRPPLGPEDASAFRSWAARINYVAQDRPDLSLAACVLASKMARPLLGDDALVKRVVRYMIQYSDASIEYRWQDPGAPLRRHNGLGLGHRSHNTHL